MVQTTMKLNCQMKIRLKMIVRFPEYAIDGDRSRYKQGRMSNLLREQFSNETEQQCEVFLKVIGEHENHVTGELAGCGQRIDQSVKNKIKEVLAAGLRNPSEVQNIVSLFSREKYPESPETDRMFYPTLQDVRNHMFLTLNGERFSADDQKNLSELISEWQSKSPEDHFHFRPALCEDDNVKPLLFVHQSKFQKALLQKYGKDIVLMDSTYKTTKYDVPLFFICVLTNVGYAVVCSFVLGKETKENIKEALLILQEWNPGWKTESFMCDMDQREISAVEELFEGTTVYICEWHREQAWGRWFKRNRVGKEIQETVLKLLRQMAHSNTESEYNLLVEELRCHPLNDSNPLFKNWMEKYWIHNCKRWVRCFRKSGVTLKVNTTNGVEAQNKILKYHYLKRCGGSKTLSSLVTILTQEFEPDAKKRYITKNVRSLKTFKKYSDDIPNFLEERPEAFIRHCMSRIGTQDMTIVANEEYFEVSTGSGATYKVNPDIPLCTCPDWQKFNWPCKHLLNVMTTYAGYGWDFLPSSYRDLPCFNLDYSVLNEENKDDSEFLSQDLKETCPHVSSLDGDEHEDEYSLREELLELMKEINNDLYLLPLMGLKEIKADLVSARNIISRYRPEGLPTRHKQTQRKPRHSVERKNEQMPIIGDEIDEVLTGIWNSNASHDPVVEVGPFLIRNNSFHFIKSTLSDEVIDATLHILSKHVEQNVKCVTSVIMTAIFTGQENLHGLLRKDNIEVFDYLVGAINEGGFHWALIIICQREKKILYLNPLGEMHTSKEQLLLYWYNFLHYRYREGLDNEEPSGWRLQSPDHAKQSDSTSCGVYVLQFAEKFFRGESLNFTWSNREVADARYKIARTLLAEGGTPTECLQEDADEDDNFSVFINTEEEVASDEKKDGDGSTGSGIRHQSCEETTEEQAYSKDTGSEQQNASSHTEDLKNEDEQNVPVRKLRSHKKSKRMSSFIYISSEKKERKKYCVCQKSNDGGLYWQCEKCEEWMHPQCVGLDPNEEPEVFICEKCKKSDQTSKTGDKYPIPAVIEAMLDDEDEAPEEAEFLIDARTVCEYMSSAIERVQCIVKEDKKSNMPWIASTQNFLHGKYTFTDGYGYAVFSIPAVSCVEHYIRKEFLCRHPGSLYVEKYEIKGAENDEMQNAFRTDRFLAVAYVERVLVMEALVAILQAYCGASYTDADHFCRLTERHLSKVKALTEAFNICKSVKKEIEKRYNLKS